jgi:hypothetical protein
MHNKFTLCKINLHQTSISIKLKKNLKNKLVSLSLSNHTRKLNLNRKQSKSPLYLYNSKFCLFFHDTT